jgi:HD superfamily phosphohydrolase
MRHGNDARHSSKRREMKKLPNSHEHLGSFIIKNTRFEGGLTQILEDYGFDVQMISNIIKGDSPVLIANQLMHSDLDADRMDYLLRDAHYTGIKYGQFDRDYILANLVTFDAGKGQLAFGVRENAAHAVDDFLIARFSWYSQVIKNPGSAKFDIMSSHIAEGLLEQNSIYQFHDLLGMVESRDERFFWWNDIYFMNRCQELRFQNKILDPRIAELTEMLLYRRPPKTIHHPYFDHRIMADETGKKKGEKTELLGKINTLVHKLEHMIEKKGKGSEWILVDIPQKDVVFSSSKERDAIKIVNKRGQPSLLIEKENSLMRRLASYVNFVPSVYCNDSAYKLFKNQGLI